VRRFVFTGPYQYMIENVPDPKVEDDKDVLIEVKAMGICGTDMHFYTGKRKVDYPMVAGHECVGIVKEIGSKVRNVKVGDRVTIAPNYTCGECNYCRGGRNILCLEKKVVGYNYPGIFAEKIVAPAPFVYAIPDSISLEEGIVIETGTVALHAVNKADIKVGERVIVMGAGTVGILAMQFAKLNGAKVYIADLNKKRLELAKKLGADGTFCTAEEQITEQFDIVIDGAGAPPTIKQSTSLVVNGGRIILVGIPSVPVEMDMVSVIRRELTIKGSVACTTEFPDVINAIAEKKLRVREMVTHTLRFEEIALGIELMEKQEAIKPAILL